MKKQRGVKDPWTRNVYAEKGRHAGVKRGLVDSLREEEMDRELGEWKKRHAELDKKYTLDY